MLTIDVNELKDRLKSIIGAVDSIEPIGNHNLQRHLVYKLSSGSKKYVIKLYYKKNRWNREIASLKIFANTEALVPKIVDYGIFDNGLEWLVYDFIEGELLTQVHEKLSLDNLKDIYYEMGRQLGIIHCHREFDFFGSMDENDMSIQGFVTYREYFEDLMNRILPELYSFEHQNLTLLKEAENRLKSMYSILDEVSKATLCHNDFSPRNILVSEIDDKYYLKAIIDFEQSIPIDIDKELVQVYLPLIENDKVLAERFKSGYEEFGRINLSKLDLKRDFYNLHMGLGICAWAKEVNYEYYLEGMKILEETVNRLMDCK
ncbi:aminoglycoside phosphotransferase family protein [Tissierella carlieri]|uniref:Aminoglycoside phosphotransferase family protein n=1 Tax=Tissierella carlieri TaxID=689904 RepID=A0ABT1SF23_9FIRM|nr:aminoglycoside phosphotransferase family protein [Tissierella carlieri]MCQ4925093.1 aminoglycoside phosphotransferase family protein [Tissierella carlieri]